jgi:hypothetical protein
MSRAICLYRISLFLGLTFVVFLWSGRGLTMGSETTGWIGLSLMEFGYKEFGDHNELLDREDGLLPGLTLGVMQPWNNWFGVLEAGIYSGEVTYDGKTQREISLETDTDELIVDGTLHLGYWFNRPESFSYALYGGLGYRYWRRDIRPTMLTNGTPVAGLLETYQWKYGLLGFKANFNQSDIVHWKIDVRLIRTIDPAIEADFQGFGRFDNTRLELGEKYGTHINMSWNYSFSKTQSFEIVPFYEQWDLGPSPEKTVTSNGVPVGTRIFEPRSETRNIGISIMLKFEL